MIKVRVFRLKKLVNRDADYNIHGQNLKIFSEKYAEITNNSGNIE